MGEKVGNECKLYIGATLVPKVRDNELNLKASEIDKTSRNDDGWRGKRAGLREWGASFDMIYDPDDTTWVAFRDAFMAGTNLTVSILDGADGSGITGLVAVTEFTRGEPLDGMVTTKVTLIGTTKPTWD